MLIIKFKEVYSFVITIQFTCFKNIGNRVKQCENLRNKLKGVNVCCFSANPAKTCAK